MQLATTYTQTTLYNMPKVRQFDQLCKSSGFGEIQNALLIQ